MMKKTYELPIALAFLLNAFDFLDCLKEQ